MLRCRKAAHHHHALTKLPCTCTQATLQVSAWTAKINTIYETEPCATPAFSFTPVFPPFAAAFPLALCFAPLPSPAHLPMIAGAEACNAVAGSEFWERSLGWRSGLKLRQ